MHWSDDGFFFFKFLAFNFYFHWILFTVFSSLWASLLSQLIPISPPTSLRSEHFMKKYVRCNQYCLSIFHSSFRYM